MLHDYKSKLLWYLCLLSSLRTYFTLGNDLSENMIEITENFEPKNVAFLKIDDSAQNHGVHLIPASEIVSGERLQLLASVFLGSERIFNFHTSFDKKCNSSQFYVLLPEDSEMSFEGSAKLPELDDSRSNTCNS